MKRSLLLLAAALAGGMLAVAIGCGTSGSRRLSGIQPETRHTMELVMDKIGQHYQVLEVTVDKGQFLEAAGHADAIAALGSYLAPYRDPGMPESYVALQADFDEAARELAVAARLGKAHETTQLFDEMQRTCRGCHQEFGVKLKSPYSELGWTDDKD